MQIFRTLAGYSLGRADIVRRAMSKKKHDVMERERHAFLYGEKDSTGNIICCGALANGVDLKTAEEIYDDVALFSSYAFNKSHAAAYTVIAYQTAYLKCHYPRQYMAALLSSVLDSGGKIGKYSAECTRMGIKILPPDVNESNLYFSVSNNAIRFGLLAIKNLGEGVINRIIQLRKQSPFSSMMDFCRRMSGRDFNRRALEGLIKSGAMDCFSANRRQMLQSVDEVMKLVESEAYQTAGGQQSLFDMPGFEPDIKNEFFLPNVEEMPKQQLLAFEKEATGLYLSGHPLKDYDSAAKRIKAAKVTDILEHEYKDNDKVCFIALVDSVKIKTTKSGDAMAFLSVEDRIDTIQVTVFPKLYAKCRKSIEQGKIVLITGRVAEQEDRPSEIICDNIEPAEQLKMINPVSDFRKLYLRIPGYNSALLERINKLLGVSGAEVIIYCEDTSKRFRASKFADFGPGSNKWQELCRILGENNIKLVE